MDRSLAILVLVIIVCASGISLVQFPLDSPRPLLRLCSGVKRFYNCLETFPSDLDLETNF